MSRTFPLFGTWTYIVWLILFLVLPIIALGVSSHRALWRRRRAILLTLAIAIGGGWAWDKLAIGLGAWVFDPSNILGLWIGGLPMEEWCWIIATTLLFGGLTVLLADRAGAEAEPLSTSAQEPEQVPS